jgi:glucosylceramidase
MKNHLAILLLSIALLAACKKSNTQSNNGTTAPPVVIPPTPISSDMDCWLTTGDRNSLLTKQTTAINFTSTVSSLPTITVDSAITYQTVDGFGYTLTQGSAYVINQLPSSTKASLLSELFGNSESSIGISYLRIGIGATDLSSSVYTYDDMSTGQTDITLNNFSLAKDMADVIPLLKEILAINPSIKILATPWTAPVWMKDNNSSIGGSLQTQYYDVYAKYFVKYIQAMKAQGITIDAITPQNEPLHPGNNPSLYMTAAQQTNFIKNNLGPAFATNNITTKIIAYDHNCDRPDYPLEVLNDATARQYVDGAAFHLYAGDISALMQIHSAYPTKNVYFTEQYTASSGSFSGDLKWHLKNVIIGSMRNWSKVALEWNLANDASYGPHTAGGCTTCLGAITINSGTINKNVAYYIIGQASKFVPAGSLRIASDNYGSISTVAFLRPDGKKALIVLNDNTSTQSFAIKYKNRWATTSLLAGAVATYIW